MQCKDRNGNFIKGNDSQDKILRYLYESKIGRGILWVLIRPFISKIGGFCLKTRISRIAIKSFVKNNNIDLNQYQGAPYKSYNDFFIRKIKDGARNFDMEKEHFPSPADSKLSVYKITEDGKFNIKDTLYTFKELTRSEELEKKYKGGYLMIFRLSVDDYHRYAYVDSGVKTENISIDGLFHTVNPLATDILPIYKENQREYTILESENFGDLMIMEVGALMVGKIVNYHGAGEKVERGMEKGRFEFGGSTVIIAVEDKKIDIDDDILENSKLGFETKVMFGEQVAMKTIG